MGKGKKSDKLEVYISKNCSIDEPTIFLYIPKFKCEISACFPNYDIEIVSRFKPSSKEYEKVNVSEYLVGDLIKTAISSSKKIDSLSEIVEELEERRDSSCEKLYKEILVAKKGDD